MDYFLFENHKGYCVHFAGTAVVTFCVRRDSRAMAPRDMLLHAGDWWGGWLGGDPGSAARPRFLAREVYDPGLG